MLLSNSLFIDEEYKLDCEHKLNYLERITTTDNDIANTLSSNDKLVKDISTSYSKVVTNAETLIFIEKSNTNAEINNNE